MVSMPGQSFSGTPPALDDAERALAEQLSADVRRLAVDIGERNVARKPEALAAASSFVELQLRGMGYAVEKQRYEAQRFAPRYAARTPEPSVGHPVENLIAERRGKGRAAEIVVVGAHYDSAEGTPGADDNASGVAAALALARAFAARAPERTVRFVFFVNEEPPWFEGPHMGSDVYAAACRARGDDVVAMFSLETLGFFSDAPGSQQYPFPFSLVYPSTGAFVGFVGDLPSQRLVHESVRLFRTRATVASEGASVPGSIEGIDWSDHASFWRHGYRAVMVTDTAPFRNPHYHEPTDLPPTLDVDRLVRAVRGLDEVVTGLAASSERW
ncbi:MAG: M20/M25/M40 family metallo-hydrolase [Deltaproteobacteria bacterium]|nr:M20/M25/M40 family metallo-hydrolase [Deltaproteobacteria bacterium]